MNRKVFGIAAAAGAAIIIAGCGQGSGTEGPKKGAAIPTATVKPGEEASLMPMTEGSQWTYSVETTIATKQRTRTDTSVLIYRVAKAEKTAEGVKATFEVLAGDKVSNRQTFLMKPQGLYQLASSPDLRPFSSPQPIIPFPPDKGKTFTWSGTTTSDKGKASHIDAKGVIQEPLEVDTESAGRISAIGIRMNLTVKTDGEPATATSETTSWYAPNVGLVRLFVETHQGDNTLRQLLKLKTYSLKK